MIHKPGTKAPRDWCVSHLPEERRKAIILWEMLDRPLGGVGLDTITTATRHATNEQIVETLRSLR